MRGFHTLATDGRKMFVVYPGLPSTFISSPLSVRKVYSYLEAGKKTSQEIKKKKYVRISQRILFRVEQESWIDICA